MNPMYFLAQKNPSGARYWWIRTGTLDNNTSHTLVGNLAAITTGLADNVNSAMYWDGGHAVNEGAPEFIAWVAKVTGYSEAWRRVARAAATHLHSLTPESISVTAGRLLGSAR